jgi:hypothetical protein
MQKEATVGAGRLNGAVHTPVSLPNLGLESFESLLPQLRLAAEACPGGVG